METQLPPKQGHTLPTFRPMFIVARRLDGSRYPLGTKVGLGPGNIVFDADPAPPRGRAPPQFSAHVCCGQTAWWIKMPLGKKVGLDPGHIVLYGDPASPIRAQPPQFSAHVYCGQTIAHLSYCWALVTTYLLKSWPSLWQLCTHIK